MCERNDSTGISYLTSDAELYFQLVDRAELLYKQFIISVFSSSKEVSQKNWFLVLSDIDITRNGITKIVSEYDQVIPQSQSADKTGSS